MHRVEIIPSMCRRAEASQCVPVFIQVADKCRFASNWLQKLKSCQHWRRNSSSREEGEDGVERRGDVLWLGLGISDLLGPPRDDLDVPDTQCMAQNLYLSYSRSDNKQFNNQTHPGRSIPLIENNLPFTCS